MAEYIREPEVPGKWYVSEGTPMSRADGHGIERIRPHRSDCRLAGPFDTEADARAAMEANPHWYEPFCWQSLRP
jgi:hypothetical protein